MLERLARYSFYCFLDGCFAYTQISVAPGNQKNVIWTV